MTQAETTPPGQETSANRDPRLRQTEQHPSKHDKQNRSRDDQRVVVLVNSNAVGRPKGSEQQSEKPPAFVDRHKHLAPVGNGRQRGRSPLHEDIVTPAEDKVRRTENHQGRSPVYEDLERQRRGERDRPPEQGNFGARGAGSSRHRGKGAEFDRRQRELDKDNRKGRKPFESEKPDKREELRKRNFHMRDRNREPGGRRGKDHGRYRDEVGRPGKPRFGEEDLRGREGRRGGFETRFVGPPARADRSVQGPPPNAELRPRHLSDEPPPKKPKPLLPEHELLHIRQRRGHSPLRGRATPPVHPADFRHPPSEQEPFDFDNFDPHVAGPDPRPPFHQPPRHPGDLPPHRRFHEDHVLHGPPDPNFHPLPMQDEFGAEFEIPRELMLDQQSEIMRQASVAV